MSTFEQYDISSSFSSIVVVCHSCFRELAPRNCIFDPIELRYTRMTVVWWSLRLCPSLVAWIYIGRFLGKSFFVFWSLGANKIKNYHTYIPYPFYHNSRIFMAGFQWNHYSSQRKKIFSPNFSEIRRIISTWSDGQTYRTTQAQSSSYDSPVFAHHHHHKLPSRPSFHVPSLHDIYWHHLTNIEDTGPILFLYVAIHPFWRNFGNWRNPIIHVLRVFCKILHNIISNRVKIAHFHKPFFSTSS